MDFIVRSPLSLAAAHVNLVLPFRLEAGRNVNQGHQSFLMEQAIQMR